MGCQSSKAVTGDYLPPGTFDVSQLSVLDVPWFGPATPQLRCKCLEVHGNGTILTVIMPLPLGFRDGKKAPSRTGDQLPARKITLVLDNAPAQNINASSDEKEGDSERAARFIIEQMKGSTVWVEPRGMDQWGRMKAEVYLTWAQISAGEDSVNKMLRKIRSPQTDKIEDAHVAAWGKN